MGSCSHSLHQIARSQVGGAAGASFAGRTDERPRTPCVGVEDGPAHRSVVFRGVEEVANVLRCTVHCLGGNGPPLSQVGASKLWWLMVVSKVI